VDAGFLTQIFNSAMNFDFTSLTGITLIQVIFWLAAGIISFYFSIGNARVWTSISVGFFLIFLSQAYTLNPWTMYNKMVAIHYIIGTVAIFLIAHGFLEYYVFCRTLEITGSKKAVYITTVIIITIAGIFLVLNPKPSFNSLRNLRLIENAVWVFLSIFVIDLIRKIYFAIKDSTIANGFVAFAVVFFFILLWKGSELYLQIYQWDKDWLDIIEFTGEDTDVKLYPVRVEIAQVIYKISGLLSGLSVGGTFAYLYKLLR
jgi:hypothetical protein